MLTHTFKAMNTRFCIWLDAQESAAREALKEAETFVRTVERTVSRFRPDSPLSEVNRSPGRWHTIPPLMATIVREALRWAAATEGLFDPTVLPALEGAGYARSFDEIARTGVPVLSPNNGREPCGRWQDIRLEGNRLYLPPDTGIDLGGIAKEWTADYIAERLAEWGACLVDAGGDIRAVGAPELWGAWPVGIEHPTRPHEDVLVLALRDAAVATSSRARRRWRVNGHECHHIIDPRTGRPAKTPALSVSVVAPTAVQAGIASKVALILGLSGEEGANRLRPMSPYGLVVVWEDGTIHPWFQEVGQ